MTREEALRALVQFDQPIENLRAMIADFDFDWDGPPLATLRREHVLEVLVRWKRSELDDAQVEDWANLVEVRDDLVHDPADPVVADAIFDLANPVLQGTLREVAPDLLKRLGA